MNLRYVWLRLAVGTLGLATVSGVAGAHAGNESYYACPGWGSHMTDGWGHMGAWGGGWMILWGLLWLVLLVVVVAALVRWLTQESGRGDDAMDTLRERYARGDIDHEEFDRRRSQLLE